MGEKIWVLEQSLIAANGSGLSHHLVSFTEERLAKQARGEAEAAFKEAMGAHLCSPGPQGFKPIGMTVAQLFASAGIVGFKVTYHALEPRGALLLAPTPQIKLQ